MIILIKIFRAFTCLTHRITRLNISNNLLFIDTFKEDFLEPPRHPYFIEISDYLIKSIQVTANKNKNL